VNHLKTLTALVLVAAIFLPLVPAPVSAAGKNLIIGSGRRGEEMVLGKVMIALLESKGFTCQDRTGLGGPRLLRTALLSGQLDLLVSYTLTDLIRISGSRPPFTRGEEIFKEVSRLDLERNDLVWLPALAADRSRRLLMPARMAAARKIASISDLAARVRTKSDQYRLGLSPRFLRSRHGYPALAEAYGLEISPDKIRQMDETLLFKALAAKAVEVVAGPNTGAAVAGMELAVLDDDRRFFAADQPAPVVRRETATRHPEVNFIISGLAPRLTSAELADLNFQVQIQGRDPARAAREWLEAQGLI
jgi:osmoprotectant transport system substrate-binding protein